MAFLHNLLRRLTLTHAWPLQQTCRRNARMKNLQIIWCNVVNEQKTEVWERESNSFRNSYKMRGWSPSGPGDLVTPSLFKLFKIICSSISMLVIEVEEKVSYVSGAWVFVSSVNTLEKNSRVHSLFPYLFYQLIPCNAWFQFTFAINIFPKQQNHFKIIFGAEIILK